MSTAYRTSLVSGNKVPASKELRRYFDGIIERFQRGVYFPADVVELSTDIMHDLLHINITGHNRSVIMDALNIASKLGFESIDPENVQKNGKAARKLGFTGDTKKGIDDKRLEFQALAKQVRCCHQIVGNGNGKKLLFSNL